MSPPSYSELYKCQCESSDCGCPVLLRSGNNNNDDQQQQGSSQEQQQEEEVSLTEAPPSYPSSRCSLTVLNEEPASPSSVGSAADVTAVNGGMLLFLLLL